MILSEKHLSLSMMHGRSESQLQHNIKTSMCLFNSLWEHFWISVVSLSQTFLHTHSTVGETPPWQRNDRFSRINSKKQRFMRKD